MIVFFSLHYKLHTVFCLIYKALHAVLASITTSDYFYERPPRFLRRKRSRGSEFGYITPQSVQNMSII